MTPEKLTQITLPWPISTHKAFRQFNGAHLSKEYRLWRDHAGWQLLTQKPPSFEEPVHITVSLNDSGLPKRRRDCENYLKGPLDLLVTHKVIPGDDARFVRSVKAEWVDSGPPCTVTVRSA